MHIELRPLENSFLKLGQRTKVDIFDANGRLLLVKGALITPSILKRALEQSVFTLSTITAPPPMKSISKEIHSQLVHSFHRIYQEAGLITSEQLAETVVIVEKILNELKGTSKLALNFAEFEEYDDYTFAHSVNVAIFTAAMGLKLGYNGKALRDLTLGALLHDLGKLSVPLSILHKTQALTDKEYKLIKKHPSMGLERLKDVTIPPAVKCIIGQHHEKWNGTGYPHSLRDRSIHPYAQIVSISDVFDALISDRPYRKGLPPYHAFEIIMAGTQVSFTEDVVKGFKNCVVLYPEHSFVTLNSGETGRVIAIPTNFPTRPLVQVLFDQYGKYLEKHYTIDLMKELNKFVTSIKYQPATYTLSS